MIDGNALFTEFISKNWMPLVFFFAILKAIFPDSRILNAIGEMISTKLPILKGK